MTELSIRPEEIRDALQKYVADYEPSAHPGCLAPHFWMDDDRSLYDRFGPGYTLLVDREGPFGEVSALQQAAARRQVPLTVVATEDPRFGALYQARYALVRPDQHVAWRGDRLPDPLELIDRVRGALMPSPTERPE